MVMEILIILAIFPICLCVGFVILRFLLPLRVKASGNIRFYDRVLTDEEVKCLYVNGRLPGEPWIIKV